MFNQTEYCREWRKTHKNSERQSHNKWYSKRKHPCPVCGVLIGYKSQRCRKHIEKLKGEGASNWKGGRTQDRRGYISLKLPNHPLARKNGYVYEHIVIWEQVHGQILPTGFVIHHLNGITSDNRPNNLVALTSRKHSNILAAKAKRIQELEAIIIGQGILI